MADSIIAALIAGAIAVSVALLTQFAAERYRRFYDGSALAAGIVGELSAYDGGAHKLREAISIWMTISKAGRKSELMFFPFDKPTDLFFDSAVSKIGVLGPNLVEHIVFVYANLRAFRLALDLISRHHAEMPAVVFEARCEACLEALNRADERGRFLLPHLAKRANQKFRQADAAIPQPVPTAL